MENTSNVQIVHRQNGVSRLIERIHEVCIEKPNPRTIRRWINQAMEGQGPKLGLVEQCAGEILAQHQPQPA